MKTSKFTDRQIVPILKQAESDTPAATLCREHGISGHRYLINIKKAHLPMSLLFNFSASAVSIKHFPKLVNNQYFQYVYCIHYISLVLLLFFFYIS